MLEFRVHFPVPEQPPPDQPVKVDPVSDVAVSEVAIGEAYDEAQVLPQLMIPSELDTLPVPVPVFDIPKTTLPAGIHALAIVQVMVLPASALVIVRLSPASVPPPVQLYTAVYPVGPISDNV